ncbi:MAG: hypothetical protein CVU43_18295 [Chloroflexi bacterium HGW-Chloroflexi-5]|jgi:hypothetical protein|nr:MAG: hypothetical protein CVU54_08200 [Deltaproteobacteria bacterium HGW-Deltaproteobacteria-12]PKN96907.1 MAG: hypothetical protein CVU43_18295 [Chloroflexi bacterium HGW-Chloroflexi-5]
MTFQRLSDTQLEIREGGGCLSIFGLPFFAAGIFMLLVAAELLPIQNAPDLNSWIRLIVAGMGIIFAAVGGGLMFGRTRILIDTTQTVVRRERRFLHLLLQSQSFDLKLFSSVELGLEAGDSDSADSYPVNLRGAANTPLRVTSVTDYVKSLDQARQLALFLHLPLEDATSRHKTVWAPDEMDKPLAERLQINREGDAWAAPPLAMHSKAQILSGRLQIIIPRGRLQPLTLLPALIPFAILYYLIPGLIEFFYRTQTPEQVQWVFVGFLMLVLGLFPAVSLLKRIVESGRGYTEIIITGGKMEITEQSAWKKTAAVIQKKDIVGLDYETVSSQYEQAAQGIHQYRMKRPGAMVNTGTRPLPAWAKMLSRLGQSKGVAVKHRGGIYTFGAGLPDDEIKYLYSLILRAIAGKI